MDTNTFQSVVWDYYHEHARTLPWRQPEPNGQFDPYKILVSELMLQQTQVARVAPKFEAFLQQFPTVESLANAPLSDVLRMWSGLGYNRRAKYLHEAAKHLADVPQSWQLDDLRACKGIGPNTAAAIVVYSYNQYVPFIETNIRTVFIHHFFHDMNKVPDTEITPLLDEMIDREHSRDFYWALMDYGVFLKATVGNASRASKHYAKQSTFEGSKRQVRGRVLRVLQERDYTLHELGALVSDDRLETVLADLCNDGLVTKTDTAYHLG